MSTKNAEHPNISISYQGKIVPINPCNDCTTEQKCRGPTGPKGPKGCKGPTGPPGLEIIPTQFDTDISFNKNIYVNQSAIVNGHSIFTTVSADDISTNDIVVHNHLFVENTSKMINDVSMNKNLYVNENAFVDGSIYVGDSNNANSNVYIEGKTVTQIIDDKFNNLIGAAPAAFDTLEEIAKKLEDVDDINALINEKANKKDPTFNGIVNFTNANTVGITSLDTVTQGTWNASKIGAEYVKTTDITSLGTVTQGTWNASTISAEYIETGIKKNKILQFSNNQLDSSHNEIVVIDNSGTEVGIKSTKDPIIDGIVSLNKIRESITIVTPQNNNIFVLDYMSSSSYFLKPDNTTNPIELNIDRLPSIGDPGKTYMFTIIIDAQSLSTNNYVNTLKIKTSTDTSFTDVQILYNTDISNIENEVENGILILQQFVYMYLDGFHRAFTSVSKYNSLP